MNKGRLLKNIDLYIALSVSVVLILYDFWEDASESTYRQVIVLQLIVISLLLLRNAGYLREFMVNFHGQENGQSIADVFLKSEMEESDLLDGNLAEIKILQETGNLFLEKNKERIIGLANRGVKILFLVSVGDSSRAGILAFRNENLPEANSLRNRSNLFIKQFSYVSKNAKNPENIKLRFTYYDPGYTLCLAKSDMRKMGIVRLAGFRVPYPRKLGFLIDQRSSATFLQYESEFDALYSSGSRVLLLTGEPKSGKTSIFKKALSNSNSKIFTCISEEVVENGQRVAFSLVWGGHSREFARKKNSTSKKKSSPFDYGVDQNIMAQLSSDILAHAGPIFFIDEIGPLQLKSQAFVDAIEKIIARPEVWVIATVAKENSHPFLGVIKSNPRSDMIELTSQNSGIVEDKLRAEMDEIHRILSIY